MTPEEVFADLRERAPRLAGLALGRGDPLDLAAALLPTTSEATAAAAARGVAQHPARVAELAVVHDVEGLERVRRLAFVAALAHTARHLDAPAPWRDLVDDALHDLLGRPHAWRDLSAAALSLELVLDLPEASPAHPLLHQVARAALDAPPPEALARSERLLRQARLRSRVTRWGAWVDQHAAALAAPLRAALQAIGTDAVPLAASEGPPDALARVPVGEALDGELTLAVMPGGVVLEWDGDGPVPTEARVDGLVLPAEDDTIAYAAWRMDVPPSGALVLELEGPQGTVRIDWGTA